MFLNNSFGKTMDILHRTMGVSSKRQQVLANNIANADTPNFKRSEVNFEAELKRVLDTKPKKRVSLQGTHPKHISNIRERDYRNVSPQVRLDYLSTADNNGNNVDLEEESMLLLQNQLRYDLMTRSVSNQFNQISMVLR